VGVRPDDTDCVGVVVPVALGVRETLDVVA
jgi:hypothetical protein